MADIEIRLETECRNCDGSGKFYKTPLYTEHVECDQCDGRGYVPSALGEEVLEFIMFHMKYGRLSN